MSIEEQYDKAVELALVEWHRRADAVLVSTPEQHIRALFQAASLLITFNGEPEYCPYDCDNCHDEDCPCDRLGCAGYDDKKL